MATTITRLRIAAIAAFWVLACSSFAQVDNTDENEFYLIGDYNGWTHFGEDPKFSLGDDGLWHKTLNLRTDQGIKVVNIHQRLFTSTNNSVTDDMIRAKTPLRL